MLWPLYLDRTVVFRKRIRAPLANVLKIISDSEAYIQLQPFIAKVEQDNSDPHLYRVVERVPGPFDLRQITNTFQIIVSQPIEDQDGKGANFSAHFNSRFIIPKLESSVRVREAEEAEMVEVVEVVKVQLLSLIAPYFTRLMNTAHRVIMDRLAEQAEGEARD